MDLKTTGGWVSADASFLNTATANNKLTIALWAKHLDLTLENSGFRISSVTGGGSDPTRGLETHLPYDTVIYFDTSGCCGSAFRQSADIATFPDYTGLAWWTNSLAFLCLSF